MSRWLGSLLTLPAVLAQYERVHSDGSFQQLRKLFAQCERRKPLALFDHIRRAHRRPDAHEDLDVIGLYRQVQNRPALLVALLANQVCTPLATLLHQHLPPALGTPDEVVDNSDAPGVRRVGSPGCPGCPGCFSCRYSPTLSTGWQTQQASGYSQCKPLHPHGLKAQRLHGLFCNPDPTMSDNKCP